MTLMVIEQKMRSAIVAEANVNVTDEEAVQKHMQYVEFDYTTSSDSSDSSDKTVSDDEKKQVKEKAAAFAEEQRRRKILHPMQLNREPKQKMQRLIRIL